MKFFSILSVAWVIMGICAGQLEVSVPEGQTQAASPAAAISQAGASLFSFESIDGAPMPLADYAGQVILVVNTASDCGLTLQYRALQELYDRYKDQGFVVIGVPCDQFGGQEPGTEADIKEFVQKNFGVTFPLTRKTDVKGANAHPFFTWASDQKKGAFLQSSPKWNFHKFLIDRNGQLVKSFGSHVAPDDAAITSLIETLLAAPRSTPQPPASR